MEVVINFQTFCESKEKPYEIQAAGYETLIISATCLSNAFITGIPKILHGKKPCIVSADTFNRVINKAPSVTTNQLIINDYNNPHGNVSFWSKIWFDYKKDEVLITLLTIEQYLEHFLIQVNPTNLKQVDFVNDTLCPSIARELVKYTTDSYGRHSFTQYQQVYDEIFKKLNDAKLPPKDIQGIDNI